MVNKRREDNIEDFEDDALSAPTSHIKFSYTQIEISVKCLVRLMQLALSSIESYLLLLQSAEMLTTLSQEKGMLCLDVLVRQMEYARTEMHKDLQEGFFESPKVQQCHRKFASFQSLKKACDDLPMLLKECELHYCNVMASFKKHGYPPTDVEVREWRSHKIGPSSAQSEVFFLVFEEMRELRDGTEGHTSCNDCMDDAKKFREDAVKAQNAAFAKEAAAMSCRSNDTKAAGQYRSRDSGKSALSLRQYDVDLRQPRPARGYRSRPSDY